MTFSGSLIEASGDEPGRSQDINAVHRAIEERLERLIASPPGVPDKLSGAVRHSVLGQSKRVRPTLLFLIAEPGSTELDAVLDVGCAVEMVHTASLVLDDLPCMDDAKMRRQRPATHIVFGQSTAILSAITLLTNAFGIIAALDGVPAATRTHLTRILSEAVGWDGLVAGQEIDINGRDHLTSAEQVERLNWLKTGVLFVAAAEMGAVLRGLEDRRVEAVRRFARHLGVAFQTVDDLLDQTASAGQLGKDVDKDADKATLVSLFGATHARLTCEEHLAHADAALIESGINAAPIRELMTRLFDLHKTTGR